MFRGQLRSRVQFIHYLFEVHFTHCWQPFSNFHRSFLSSLPNLCLNTQGYIDPVVTSVSGSTQIKGSVHPLSTYLKSISHMVGNHSAIFRKLYYKSLPNDSQTDKFTRSFDHTSHSGYKILGQGL